MPAALSLPTCTPWSKEYTRCGNTFQIPGADIYSSRNETLDSCLKRCKADPRCNAVQFMDNPYGTGSVCYFKDNLGFPDATAKFYVKQGYAGLTGQPLRMSNIPGYNVITGRAYPDAPSLVNDPKLDTAGCAALCNRTPHCQAFVAPPGGGCQTKGYVGMVWDTNTSSVVFAKNSFINSGAATGFKR